MNKKVRKNKKLRVLIILLILILGIILLANKDKIFKNEITITSQDEIVTTPNSNINLLSSVTAKNSKNKDVKVTIRGDYDLNKPGTYELEYVATDSNKEVTKKFRLIVKEESTSKEETPSTNKPKDNSNTSSSKNNTQISSDNKTNETANKTFTTSKGFNGEIINGATYIEGILIANKTYALPENYGNGLTKETQNAFNKMQVAAKLDGLNIYISSGFRSYATQKRVYNNYVKRDGVEGSHISIRIICIYNNYVKRDGVEGADRYSSRPGHSDHQTGLAFDLNTINDSFQYTAEAKWLSQNAYKYGFTIRFPKGREEETGYKYESWHFRYVGEDLATKLYNNEDWLSIEGYFGITSTYD